jgi:hypothetical protein
MIVRGRDQGAMQASENAAAWAVLIVSAGESLSP